MIQRTFCHISGVGPTSENRIWEAGLHTWRDVRQTHPLPPLPVPAPTLRAGVQRATAHLAAGDLAFFASALPTPERIRLFPHMRDSVAYVDIETTGTSRDTDYITTICLWDGRKLFTYVYGQNLDQFAEDIRRYRYLVTYNGNRFDVPMIELHFGISLPQIHIDLHPILNALGWRGGLKKCEKLIGIQREGLDDITGQDAVTLWQQYLQTSDQRYLDTLLAYNAEDTINLEKLMVAAYNRKWADTPWGTEDAIAQPRPFELPIKPNPDIVAQLKGLHLTSKGTTLSISKQLWRKVAR